MLMMFSLCLFSKPLGKIHYPLLVSEQGVTFLHFVLEVHHDLAIFAPRQSTEAAHVKATALTDRTSSLQEAQKEWVAVRRWADGVQEAQVFPWQTY